MRMSIVTILAGVASLLTCVGVAEAQEDPQPAKDGTPAPATTPEQVADQFAKAAVEAAKPKGIPVPDMPVVATSEVEGIKIEDMKIGDGPEVKKGAMVLAHYHGTLVDGGKTFDSSFERGEPIAFPLGGVIQGWQLGVPGMKVGGIRRLTIPADKAYGEQGAGNVIPPNAALTFIIQMEGTVAVVEDKVGEGEAAGAMCVAVTAYTMKDESGKVLESRTKDNPYIWLPGEFQPVNAAIEGMKVGGKRTVTIPKEFNKPNPMGPPSSRPTDVALTVEVELISVRNLQ
jgi:FKBP-type peptidyl-prolyl cis-trans isomerase